MFFARKTKNNEIELVKKWLNDANMPIDNLENENVVFLLGELDDEPVATAGLEIYGNIGVMRGLYVLPEYRGEHLGETIARGIINLADRRGIKKLYTFIDDDFLGYLLAKMRYSPYDADDYMTFLSESCIPNAKPNSKCWVLDLDLFFSSSCCSHN